MTETGALVERDGRTPVMGPPAPVPSRLSGARRCCGRGPGRPCRGPGGPQEAAEDNLSTAPCPTGGREATRRTRAAEADARDCLAGTASPEVPVQTDLVAGVLASASIPMFFPDRSLWRSVTITSTAACVRSCRCRPRWMRRHRGLRGLRLRHRRAARCPLHVAGVRPARSGLDARLVSLLMRTIDLCLTRSW